MQKFLVEPLVNEHPLHIWMPALRVGTGADVFVERLAEGLRRQGVTVTVDWFNRRFELLPFLIPLIARMPPGTDVIHANAAYAFAFRRFDRPLVATEYHYVMDPAYARYRSAAQALYHRAWFSHWLHRSFRDADALTTISNSTANAIRRAFPAAEPKVIYPWIDPARFRPASPASEKWSGPFRLFFAGNGSTRKGGDVLPELARKLGPSFEIRCTSGLRDGDSHNSVPNLRSLGRLDERELIAAFQDCDAVLVPSRYEGFGYSALEAMACEKPVIGFACEAVGEVVGEYAGILATIDDIDALVDAIHRIREDRDLRARMGAAGRRRATEVFGENCSVGRYLWLYESLRSGGAK